MSDNESEESRNEDLSAISINGLDGAYIRIHRNIFWNCTTAVAISGFSKAIVTDNEVINALGTSYDISDGHGLTLTGNKTIKSSQSGLMPSMGYSLVNLDQPTIKNNSSVGHEIGFYADGIAGAVIDSNVSIADVESVKNYRTEYQHLMYYIDQAAALCANSRSTNSRLIRLKSFINSVASDVNECGVSTNEELKKWTDLYRDLSNRKIGDMPKDLERELKSILYEINNIVNYILTEYSEQ